MYSSGVDAVVGARATCGDPGRTPETSASIRPECAGWKRRASSRVVHTIGCLQRPVSDVRSTRESYATGDSCPNVRVVIGRALTTRNDDRRSIHYCAVVCIDGARLKSRICRAGDHSSTLEFRQSRSDVRSDGLDSNEHSAPKARRSGVLSAQRRRAIVCRAELFCPRSDIAWWRAGGGGLSEHNVGERLWILCLV